MAFPQSFVRQNKDLPAIMKRVCFLQCNCKPYVALDGLSYLQFGKINGPYMFTCDFIDFYFSCCRHGYRSRFAILQQQFDITTLFRNGSNFAY